MKHALIDVGLITLAMLAARSSAAELNAEVTGWLAAQTNIQTWSAEFVQTRSLKSLTKPLTATGRVWFAAPNRFRWELGQPPQTIAVRAPDEMLIFYPKLKRVERFPLTKQAAGQWRDALALLEAGFPRSRSELAARYDIISQTTSNHVCQLVLQPKSANARKMMRQIEIDFDTRDYSLRGTELEFADGSTLRNDFHNTIQNPKVDETMFTPPIASEYKVVEPTAHP